MNFYFLLFSLFIFLKNNVHCQVLWDYYSLPEVSNIILEEDKPIVLPQNYTKLQIKGLKGTLYSNSLSQLHGLTELRIFNNQISEIAPGAICSLPSLKTFEVEFISNDNPPELTQEMFENCENLERLALIFNYEHPTRLEHDVLKKIANLKELVIHHLPIQQLKKDLFSNKKYLTKLVLHDCHINLIDADAFDELPNLEELQIRYGNVNHLPLTLFKNTPKLTFLMLTNTNIAGLTWEEFQTLSSLKTLILSANQIVEFDAEKIANYMPNLKELKIELNPIHCKVMEAFANDLKTKLPHPIEVSYKFDPGFYDECKDPLEIQ